MSRSTVNLKQKLLLKSNTVKLSKQPKQNIEHFSKLNTTVKNEEDLLIDEFLFNKNIDLTTKSADSSKENLNYRINYLTITKNVDYLRSAVKNIKENIIKVQNENKQFISKLDLSTSTQLSNNTLAMYKQKQESNSIKILDKKMDYLNREYKKIEQLNKNQIEENNILSEEIKELENEYNRLCQELFKSNVYEEMNSNNLKKIDEIIIANSNQLHFIYQELQNIDLSTPEYNQFFDIFIPLSYKIRQALNKPNVCTKPDFLMDSKMLLESYNELVSLVKINAVDVKIPKSAPQQNRSSVNVTKSRNKKLKK